jgi:uncharacterized protein
MSTLILSKIWIYPIKSLGGIELKRAFVRQKGLLFDRRWMLIDDEGNFMTQRLHSRMALFKLFLEEGNKEPVFTITHNAESLVLPLHPATTHRIESKVWDDPVTIYEVGKPQSEWFSRQLGVDCKLVYFPEENPRPVDPRYEVNNENVSLADGYPFLIIGDASLADLNRRLEYPVPMNRFRPNLVFSGGQPYEEDNWRNFKIGENRFVGVKPCGRCVVTTVNQDTAEKGKEPLRTLASYRNRDGKIYFGQNVIAIDHGEINEGDQIELE